MGCRIMLLVACAAGCGEDIRDKRPARFDAAPMPFDSGLAEPDAAATAGQLHVTWTVERDGEPIACDDTGAVALTTVELRLSPTAGGPALVYSADCTDGQLVIDGLAPGSYIARLSSTGQGIDPGQKVVRIAAGQTTEAALVLGAPSGGMVHLSWLMEREGVPLSCAELGWVSVMLTLDGDDGGLVYPCDSYYAFAGPYEIGTHTISLVAWEFSNAAGASLGATDVSFEVSEHGQTVAAQALFEYFDEPEKQLLQLFDAAAFYYSASPDPKTFPTSAGPSPSASSCNDGTRPYDPDPSHWDSEPWLTLGFSIDHRHWARYGIQTSGSGSEATFQVTAYLDTDCDGSSATYWLVGTVDEGGNVVGRDNLVVDLSD